MFTSFDGSLQSVDLAGAGVRSVAVPDGTGYFVAADDENGLVLVAQPNSDPTGQDKNHLASVRVFDTHLGLVSTVQRFNLYNTPLRSASSRSTRRRGPAGSSDRSSSRWPSSPTDGRMAGEAGRGGA